VATDTLDGRRQRAARSRDAVLDAILDLLREGDMRPGADEIAARAGVSPRTVFRHFDDFEELFAAAADRQTERIAHLFNAPPEPTVAALVTHRATLYEAIAPIRRAGLRHAPFHAALSVRLDRAHRILRRQLEGGFGATGDLLDALDAATSWAAWDVLRSDQRLSVARARRVMTLTVTALLKET
jgi:AcrR family transcriptional regulator